MSRPLAAAVGLAMLLSGRAAMAQACTASSSGPTFGAYDPAAASASSITGTVTMTCNTLIGLLVSYTIQLDGGANGTVVSRAMASGASRLAYQLYTNAAHNIVWGDGTGGSIKISDGYLLSVGSTSKSYPVYGLIPAHQNVAAGGYLDTVTILITY